MALVACARQERGELVAAGPRQQIARADVPGEPDRKRTEQRVAGSVAERVVDRLEVVDIDHQTGERPMPLLGFNKRLGEPRLEVAAVRQIGKGIVIGELLGMHHVVFEQCEQQPGDGQVLRQAPQHMEDCRRQRPAAEDRQQRQADCPKQEAGNGGDHTAGEPRRGVSVEGGRAREQDGERDMGQHLRIRHTHGA